MESQKKVKNRRKRQQTLWILWGLTIWLILLLILFGKGNDSKGRMPGENSVPAVSDNIAESEHVPGNADGKPTAALSPALSDIIEEQEHKTPGPDGNVENMNATVTVPDAEGAEDITLIPEPDVEDGGQQMGGDSETEDGAEQTGAESSGDTEEAVWQERIVDPDRPMIALTFDDGPYRDNTKALLDLFEQYNSRATFFVVGYHLEIFYEDALDAYRRGFQIGNHTTNHPSLSTVDGEKAMAEIRDLNAQLNNLGIPGDVMVRPPYGIYTKYLQENLTVPMIGWNVDSEDWKSRDADKIYSQIVGKVKDGDIVLMHDLHNVTVEAMERVVPELVAQGFQLVTVEEMFEAKGIEPQAGKYYGYIR